MARYTNPETGENMIECDSCAESGEHGVPATTKSTNPNWSGYDLCEECAREYNSRETYNYSAEDN